MKLKRLAAAAAASSMVVTVMAVTASAYEYSAFLMFTDTNWLWGNWDVGKGTDAVVTGPGTYTVSLDSTQAENTISPAVGANVFCVDIPNAYADLAGMEVTLDSITADGNEVKFDPEKICYGDIEEKGNYRIEIHNAYGLTGKSGDEHYGAIDWEGFTAADKIAVTFTVSEPGAAANAPAEEEDTVTQAPETEPEKEEETSAEVTPAQTVPAGDTDTISTETGDTTSPAAPIAGVMGVAGVSAAAAAVTKKKNS